MPKGQGPWGDLFKRLIDVRPWRPQDRIEEEAVRYWQEELDANPDQPVRLEVEYWYFESDERRARARASVQQMVHELGGVVLDSAQIPEIRYEAALVRLSAVHVRTLIDNQNISLARSDDIMYLRPQTAAVFPAVEELTGVENQNPPAPVDFIAPDPVVALLDGLPIQNHSRLVGRLRVDDPDNLEATYLVRHRAHGTSMASLIIHGDLAENNQPLRRPIYVRPVLRPTASGAERSPEDRLFVDVIHQAVRRIKEGEAGQPPAAPTVMAINFSIGDKYRPFARALSPLGRLLDYLAYRYKVLFLVSTGNILDRLSVQDFQTSIEFEQAGADTREIAFLNAVNSNKSARTLFAPAEAMNVVTIGAANFAAVFDGQLPADRIDVLTSAQLPNVASAVGLGFKKTVKPDLLFNGGRMPVRVVASGDGIEIKPVDQGSSRFGLKAAFPSNVGGTMYEDFCCGSSAATALATRAVHQVYDVLSDGDGGSNHADADPSVMPLLLKALLVHTARWGDKGPLLDGIFGPQGPGSHYTRKDDITRLLGYGFPTIERVLDCAANQATLVGHGTITPGAAIVYRIPLPEDLDGVLAFRTLTTTLTWFTPINLRHQGYRRAALDVSPASDEKYWIASERERYQPTDKAIGRGTLWHEHRSAEEATVFVDDGHLGLRISCRATAGDLNDSIPFALAVTFEVGVQAGIEVYEPVREAVEAQIRANVSTQ